jgi:hypothetical protein
LLGIAIAPVKIKKPASNEVKSMPEQSDVIPLAELQRQLNDSLQQLSPERLQVLADFAAYLANAESEAATQELLAIPGLLERVKQNQLAPKSDYTNWRTIRSDV